ncbi:MAG: hypothetical protein A2623_10385 [Caulobacterales bacterium RIFCSPHIGHO2_01_FULL_70_19]|nr:MAG: hypothetical protein A2623_10385 [Caulobacterales bacterium RIFCSPHIGHO2_01_FULL_70_19]
MRIGQNAVRTQAALAAAIALLTPGAAAAGPADAYYERAFVVAADARCDLFPARTAAALAAAAAQARGAALRAGASPVEVAAVAARARSRARAVACADPQLTTVRRRVDDAFAGWSRTPRMTFPGARLDWTADRYGWDRAGWRLKQTTTVGASPIAFGLAGKGEAPELAAVISWHGRPRPYAARMVLRDPTRLSRPWVAGNSLPPSAARASFWAAGVEAADPALRVDGQRPADIWRFPAAAAAALEALDPREAFAVEFHFRDGSVATARLEAGDFAAGRAFLRMGRF